MKIKLIVTGKTDEAWLAEGLAQYASRLKHYTSFEIVNIPALKNAASLPPAEIKKREGELILKQLAATDQVILLDEKGKEFTSRAFAGFIQNRLNSNIKVLAFIVGGAWGFSSEVYERAGEKISLSKMTFSHQMIRLFFVEQLYRAFTILKGEKYHND